MKDLERGLKALWNQIKSMLAILRWKERIHRSRKERVMFCQNLFRYVQGLSEQKKCSKLEIAEEALKEHV